MERTEMAEDEGFEPPRPCGRRISSPLPCQLGLVLRAKAEIEQESAERKYIWRAGAIQAKSRGHIAAAAD